jgi:hypothetical protein
MPFRGCKRYAAQLVFSFGTVTSKSGLDFEKLWQAQCCPISSRFDEACRLAVNNNKRRWFHVRGTFAPVSQAQHINHQAVRNDWPDAAISLPGLIQTNASNDASKGRSAYVL